MPSSPQDAAAAPATDARATDQLEATTARDGAARPWRTGGGWLLLAVALSVGFGHNFSEMWIRWFPAWRHLEWSLYDRMMEGASYYTHGPLIPVVSLAIIALLIRYVALPVRPNRWAGGMVLGASLLLHLLASLARVNFISGFALIGVLVGVVLLVWGWRTLLRVWFPIVFLAFMVPLPEFSIAQLNFRLKMLAAEAGVWLADAVGVIVSRSGARVFLPEGKELVIANICNGLRTLISLLAFGALFAYVCRLRGVWRLVLFALSVPVALVSNSIRIMSLIIVADVWNEEVATGFFHDFSGGMIFIIAFLLMFGLERGILWGLHLAGRAPKTEALYAGQRRDPDDGSQWKRLRRAVGSRRGYVTAVSLLLAGIAATWLGTSTGPGLAPDMVRGVIPETLQVDGKVFRSYEAELDEQTLLVLENPSYVLRRYTARDGRPIDFSLIFSKDNRKGTHPPDLCLEGGGQDIVAKTDLDVPTADGATAIACRELVTQHGSRRSYHIYTYRCGGRYTRSFWVQQATIFGNGLLRRNASGALISVTSPVVDDVDQARQRAIALLQAALPHIESNLP